MDRVYFAAGLNILWSSALWLPAAHSPSPDMFIRELWAAVEVSDSAVGTLIELWLTCCHGNSYSLTMGQKCFYLPVLHKQSGWSVWLQKCWPSSSICVSISFCHGKEHKHRWTFRILISWNEQARRKYFFGLFFFKKNIHWCWTKSSAVSNCSSVLFIQETAEIRIPCGECDN